MDARIPGFVVILGSPNDDQGNLSEMGRGRVALGRQMYHLLSSTGYRILLTGGFGSTSISLTSPTRFTLGRFLSARVCQLIP